LLGRGRLDGGESLLLDGVTTAVGDGVG